MAGNFSDRPSKPDQTSIRHQSGGRFPKNRVIGRHHLRRRAFAIYPVRKYSPDLRSWTGAERKTPRNARTSPGRARQIPCPVVAYSSNVELSIVKPGPIVVETAILRR